MRGDKHVPIIKVTVISTKPNGLKAIGEKSSPIKLAVEGFAFELLPFLLRIGSTASREQLLRYKSRQVNQLILKKNGIRTFEKDIINGLFLILEMVVVRGNG